MKKIQTRIKPEHAQQLGLDLLPSGCYRITEEQYRELQEIRTAGCIANNDDNPRTILTAKSDDGRLMDIDEYCQFYNIPRAYVKSYKLVTHTGIPYYNIQSVGIALPDSKEITPEYIKEVVSGIKFDKSDNINPNGTREEILRVIITDIHVGMETDAKGYGLYSEVWNEEVLFSRLDMVIDECARIKRDFKEVHVIDLGDMVDGWNSLTTRGGHALPQNMSNRKTFDVGVRFKTELYSSLQSLFQCPVVAYNVCNDNHSSDFGFIVNETVRMICEASNPYIKVNNLQRFMDHYIYGDHCFILTHGKDEAHMKFGFKPKLDAVVKDKIMSYIKHYDIKSKYITLEKGDSHQQLMDSTSSVDFEYYNYRAFSPASSWCNHNFGRSTSGFTLMTVRPDKKSKGIEAIEF